MADRLLRKIAEKVNIPAEAISSAPKITVTGDSQVFVENHRGLMEYGSDIISVNGGGTCIKLRGEGLELKSMTRSELLIAGRLWSVEFE